MNTDPSTLTNLTTLVAAVMAVGGTIVVGFKQASISARQTEILDQQAALARDRWKKEMFEQRFEVFRQTEDFLSDYMKILEKNDATPREFETQVRHSQFIFRKEVGDGLKEILQKYYSLIYAYEQVVMPPDVHTEEFKRMHANDYAEIQEWMRNRLKTLPDLFGDELRLGDSTIRSGSK